MNEDLQKSFYTLLQALNTATLGNLPVAWPSVPFTPPASGYWLEVAFFPNTPIDNGLPDNASIIPQGFFQVSACGRPAHMIPLSGIADKIVAGFPRGTAIDVCRVVKTPNMMTPLLDEKDRVILPVVIYYRK